MASIGREVGFGQDNFSKPKILNEKDSISTIILNLLLMKPGNMPSLPHLGINIKKYLYAKEDEINVDDLKNQIYNQCNDLFPWLLSDEVKLLTNNQDGKETLIIYIPVLIEGEEAIVYAFQQGQNGELIHNMAFQSLRPGSKK